MSVISKITGYRRRPDESIDETIESEIKTFFDLPRKSGHEMIPHLVRLKHQKKADRQDAYKKLYRQLQRARIPRVTDTMRHIIDLDKSDRIVPHGQVSKKLFEGLCQARDFDLYGRRMQRVPITEVEDRRMRDIADRLGLEYEKLGPPIIIEEYVKVPDIFQNVTGDIKLPVITTAPFKIGTEPKYHPPVGFAANPTQPCRSYGREVFYAYDGEWAKGMMEGLGTYQFEDGGTYHGDFLNNKPHGRQGLAKYIVGSSYEGEWNVGRFGGEGVMKCRKSSIYTGHFNCGRREGKGSVQYMEGLTYEGEFLDGKPHGRGKMTSTLTGYSYEGTFNKGSIEGSGALTTPPPESKRIVQFWPENHDTDILLPTVVK